MLRFQSESGAYESDSAIRATGMATTTAIRMAIAITRTDTTDLIGTTAIPGAHRTTGTGIVTTATIGTVTTTATKLA
jgi:hypothetical protein